MGIPAASDWISTGWAGNFPATTNSEPIIDIKKIEKQFQENN